MSPTTLQRPAARAVRPPLPARAAVPVLRLRGVGIGEVQISFVAHAGEIVQLGGGSPMARLRVLAMAAGLAQAGSGSCELLGQDLPALDETERRALRERHVARALGCDQLPHAASVLASVALPLVRQGVEVTTALARAHLELDALGAGTLAERRPESLTRSEGRLALIARATAARPRLLVLEQPDAGLAPAEVSALRLSLWALSSAFGTCVLMSTDHPRLAASAERRVDLDHGTRH